MCKNINLSSYTSYYFKFLFPSEKSIFHNWFKLYHRGYVHTIKVPSGTVVVTHLFVKKY